MNRCTLELRNIIDTEEVTIGGKTKVRQAAWSAVHSKEKCRQKLHANHNWITGSVFLYMTIRILPYVTPSASVADTCG